MLFDVYVQQQICRAAGKAGRQRGNMTEPAGRNRTVKRQRGKEKISGGKRQKRAAACPKTDKNGKSCTKLCTITIKFENNL